MLYNLRVQKYYETNQLFSISIIHLQIDWQQVMNDQSDEKQQNKYNCTQFEDINGLDQSIRKVVKMDGSGEKASINLQCNSFRINEQRKSVIQQIKHLARQGSQITGYLELPTQQINQYKNRSNEDAVIDEVLLDKFLPPNSITPLIFTKKLPQGGQYRLKGTQPLWVNALESLLSVVVQLYYKSDQKLAEFMKEKVLIDSKKELKQEKKPGRKKKIPDNDSPNQEQNEQQQQQSGNINVYSLLQQDVLDILISPLRNDFPFETWTTKEIAIFECGLCRYGKQYEFLSHLIKTKNAQDIIQFYYFWKFTSHYKLWKINKAYYHRSNLNNYV
ncbi:unnamed protein product [Paramecium sonneborni]|uniref:SANT domain-containing protein n=1 Tax=Paramecium sonneborni TaxID=65129 RepID=A0A8S1R0D8_9CILI|nr:unnamed protein product [Paramecium sonneborni]